MSDMLQTILTRIDDAVTAHAMHGAMAGTDPLTDSLYGQIEAAAAEGALPPSTTGAGLTPDQRAAMAAIDAYWPPLWLAGLVAVAACAASALWPWGVA